jgi:hypothetical protein
MGYGIFKKQYATHCFLKTLPRRILAQSKIAR